MRHAGTEVRTGRHNAASISTLPWLVGSRFGAGSASPCFLNAPCRLAATVRHPVVALTRVRSQKLIFSWNKWLYDLRSTTYWVFARAITLPVPALGRAGAGEVTRARGDHDG